MMQQLQVQHQHAPGCAAGPHRTEGTSQSTWGLVSSGCTPLTIVADAQLYQQLHHFILVGVLSPQSGLVALVYHKPCRHSKRLAMCSLAGLAGESCQAAADVSQKVNCRG